MRNPCRPALARSALAGLLSLALAACGSDSTSKPDGGPQITSTFTVGGTVSGLAAGAHVVLRNAAETLSVSQNGSFTFAQKVDEGAAYAVTVEEQPAGATCTLQGASGTARGNVANVAVTCSADTYAVGGTVSGLVGGSSVELQLNGGELLTVSADGPFTFAAPVADLGGYAVTVKTQPVGHACSVAQGEGTLAGAAVADVTVTCEAQAFTVRGSLLGLSQGQSVVTA